MPKPRRALSLVEVLIALAVLGVASAALAASLVGDIRLRDLAAAHAGAARRARARIESLAVRPCSRDTAGASLESWGSENWRATAGARAWRLIDSLGLRRSANVLAIEARIACPE